MTKEQKRVVLQIGLFIATLVTTTMGGLQFVNGKLLFFDPFLWDDVVIGLTFSIPFLLILTVHEFGHYFTALYHKVKATLPYYIPLPPPFMVGTLGAVIRLLEPVPSKKKNFDIGIAGPLAGFIVAVLVLFYGFSNLPPAEYIFDIHPDYKQYGLAYAEHVYQPKEGLVDMVVGKNLLFLFFEHYVADPARMPNPHEIMHYPILMAGYLALVFTFMNLMPVGQLDGGHVLYGLIGYKNHRIVATVVYIIFMFYAGIGYIKPSEPANALLLNIPLYIAFLYFCFMGLKFSQRDTLMIAVVMFGVQFLLAKFFPLAEGFSGWLVFGFVVGRFVGIPHPPCEIEDPLDTKRILLGWIALLIFILCFSPAPLVIK